MVESSSIGPHSIWHAANRKLDLHVVFSIRLGCQRKKKKRFSSSQLTSIDIWMLSLRFLTCTRGSDSSQGRRALSVMIRWWAPAMFNETLEGCWGFFIAGRPIDRNTLAIVWFGAGPIVIFAWWIHGPSDWRYLGGHLSQILLQYLNLCMAKSLRLIVTLTSSYSNWQTSFVYGVRGAISYCQVMQDDPCGSRCIIQSRNVG